MEPCTVSTPSGAALMADEGGFGFFHSGLQAGVQHLGVRLNVDGVCTVVRYSDFAKTDGGIDAIGQAGETGVQCRTELRPVNGRTAATARHVLTNTAPDGVRHVAHIVTAQMDPSSSVKAGRAHMWDLRYCHTDNLRTERYPHCQVESPYVRSLPSETVHCGVGEDQPFPAVCFTDRNYACALVMAAAAQEKTFHSWRFRREPLGGQRMFSLFEIHHELPLSGGFALDMGQSLELDATYFEILERTHPQDAYKSYVDWLAGRVSTRGAHSKLLDHALYCSWNYGRFSEQYEDKLLETARFIASNLPNIKYFLIDDGYTHQKVSRTGARSFACIDQFYPDPEASVSREKFPRGMKAFMDEVRALGLKPGLWWTPTARLDSYLYRDHPDWFLLNADGSPYRIGAAQGFLDLTQPGPRDYLDHTLAVILGQWGIEATKMDFWSHQFEDRDARVRGHNQTSLDSRRVLFELIRKHLPPDGVLMTCVATGMGNPFIAQWADTYRNTIDIGTGQWDQQVTTCYWALPALSIEGRKTFLHNNDSVGVNLDCPPNENFFRLTWCFITMGMQEVGGFLEKLPPQYVRALRKYTDRCDRGHRCLCPDEKAFRGEPLPEVLYVDYPQGSRTRATGVGQSIALFNWTDEPRVVAVRRASLGHKGKASAVNFWTDERETFAEEFLTKRLEGRSALLYDVENDG